MESCFQRGVTCYCCFLPYGRTLDPIRCVVECNSWLFPQPFQRIHNTYTPLMGLAWLYIAIRTGSVMLIDYWTVTNRYRMHNVNIFPPSVLVTQIHYTSLHMWLTVSCRCFQAFKDLTIPILYASYKSISFVQKTCIPWRTQALTDNRHTHITPIKFRSEPHLSGACDERSGHGGLVQVPEQVVLIVFGQVKPLGQASGQVHQRVHGLSALQSLVRTVQSDSGGGDDRERGARPNDRRCRQFRDHVKRNDTNGAWPVAMGKHYKGAGKGKEINGNSGSRWGNGTA